MLHWQDWVEDIGLSMDYEERSFARRMLESTLLATVVMQGGGGQSCNPCPPALNHTSETFCE
ncbi:hypothetical protein CCM_00640 [Cordyceps militaris CM01]|uniref:Uncharacterized protein n=1 Tax=Cordyceps militaris (strain CM01) TaxID=983644 RepID=G3J572_CORMM|nr:uncharacterized protein CCM_00640 [Cordyceps militaris CM01]EGX95986.1 hypothetical protein CCM_00640 [Cordyceps militaris CM01]